jgi:hypothetical protein
VAPAHFRTATETPGTSLTPANFAFVEEPPIDRMRERARQLRRIADMTHDPAMSEMLLKMAGEVEVDADRLEAERTARLNRA